MHLEAAKVCARAWFANPTIATDRDFMVASMGRHAYLLPSGQEAVDPSEHTSAWLAWAKEDAAQAPATLTFGDLRTANLARRGAWGGAVWDLPRWGNALAGEVGELCNVIKKIDRGDFTLESARAQVAHEAADVLTYLDLLTFYAGVSLEDAAVEKWNEVSRRVGSFIRLKPGLKAMLDARGGGS